MIFRDKKLRQKMIQSTFVVLFFEIKYLNNNKLVSYEQRKFFERFYWP